MWTSGFSLRSPLSNSIDWPHSQHDGSCALRQDYPVPQTSLFQQPADWGVRLGIPFRESQAPLGSPALQTAETYDTRDGGMAMGNPGLPRGPTLGATQALSSHMGTPSYMATPSSQATPSHLGSPFSPASQSAEYPDTAELDAAVRLIWPRGASDEEILSCVKTHKDAKDVGIHQAFDTMTKASPEVLKERLRAIKAALPPNTEAPVHAPSESSKNPTNEPGSSPQDRTHRRKAPRGIAPQGVVKRKASQGSTPRSKKSNPKSCPHNVWNCEKRKSKAQWKSKAKLLEHYDEHHLKELRFVGGDGNIRCTFPLCQHGPFPGDGAQFIDHLWFDHMGVRRP